MKHNNIYLDGYKKGEITKEFLGTLLHICDDVDEIRELGVAYSYALEEDMNRQYEEYCKQVEEDLKKDYELINNGMETEESLERELITDGLDELSKGTFSGETETDYSNEPETDCKKEAEEMFKAEMLADDFEQKTADELETEVDRLDEIVNNPYYNRVIKEHNKPDEVALWCFDNPDDVRLIKVAYDVAQAIMLEDMRKFYESY